MHPDVDTVIVFSEHAEDLAAFYRNAFDLPRPQRSPAHVGFALPSLYLGFDSVDDAPSPGPVSLWWRVDNVDSAFDRLVALGCPVVYAPVDKPWGDRVAAVLDPDGNRIGLSQRS
ncbi:MAG: VOC family protein [Acidimicrobiia bacterium]|nr:VOC family protein [Acidimicrobiia bacterium]